MKLQIRRSTTSIRRLAFVLLIFLPTFLTACEESDTDFLIELAFDYAEQHRLVDAEGNLNYGTIASHALFGTTGDPEADAALEAGYVVKNMADADRLAQEGAEQGDPDKIQVAIDARPRDWSYREQQAALLIAQGDMDAGTAALQQSNDLVSDRVNQGGDRTYYRLNQLRHREKALLTQLNRTDANSAEHEQLIELLEGTQREISELEQRGE